MAGEGKTDKNLVLIGFMGTGKSTVSERLGRMLGMTVIDTDEEIVRREGRPIPEIFEKEGEQYFRDLETNLLIEFQNLKGTIVSCGGGTPMREQNAAEMKKIGKVFLLTARPETILERVKDDNNRPLLAGRKNVEFISELMEKRRERYEACADRKIATDGRCAREICEEIASKLDEE